MDLVGPSAATRRPSFESRARGVLSSGSMEPQRATPQVSQTQRWDANRRTDAQTTMYVDYVTINAKP